MILNGKYYYDDPEQGYTEISKELYEILKEYFYITRPKINNLGKIMIVGTSEIETGKNQYQRIWVKQDYLK